MIHIGNVNAVINDEFIEMCTKHAMKFTARSRNMDTIIEHTITGEAVEVLVCEYLDLQQVDFEIMEYDAIDRNGVRYEIKHTTKNDKWWNYNPEYYSYFLKNAYKIDYIVLCYYDKISGDVFLKFKADAPTFSEYSSKSKFNNMSYYNVEVAGRQNLCIKY